MNGMFAAAGWVWAGFPRLGERRERVEGGARACAGGLSPGAGRQACRSLGYRHKKNLVFYWCLFFGNMGLEIAGVWVLGSWVIGLVFRMVADSGCCLLK